jgi:hypothetical protein
MGRIALRDLGYSERRLTYTNGLKLQEGRNLMNKGEVYTGERSFSPGLRT